LANVPLPRITDTKGVHDGQRSMICTE
jgi:hypothetical protein